MKLYFLLIFLLFVTVFTFSCSSTSASRRSGGESELNPEIGTATMTGGDKVDVRGYSKDSEINKKMQLLDLEIIDCYKQFIPVGKSSENTINFTVTVDMSGFIEKINVKGNSPLSDKIGECVAKDIETLSFRPGEGRELNYRLIYKPLKKSKTVNNDNPRSKMILSLSDMKKFKNCYEEELASTPGIGGNFTINFKVNEEGTVTDIKISDNTFSNTKVPMCVVKKLADTVFPEGESEDTVEVNFKFNSNAPVKMRRSMDIDM